MNQVVIQNGLQWEFYEENGKQFKKRIQLTCDKCKKLSVRCKCGGPIVETVIIEEIKIEEIQKQETAQQIAEAERLAIIDAKFKHKEEERTRRAENIRIAQLDEEEFEKEQDEKKAVEKKLQLERDQAAMKNVNEILALKKQLQEEGKNRVEIKQAVQELKGMQQEELAKSLENVTEEVEEEKKEKSNRGRKKLGALKNPVKDPLTGEFKSSEE